jgi:apolipoprotein N-acyltransferase
MNKLLRKIRCRAVENYYLLSAVLFFFSFPSYDFFLFKGYPFFAWICMVPLFVFIRNRPLRKVYTSILLTFLIGSILCFGWMRAFGAAAPDGQLVVLLFLMPALALLFSAKVFLSEYFSRKNEIFRFFIFPAMWVLFDFLQSVGYLAFPWTYLGYSQHAFLPLIQIASITGVFGVTFLILCINTLVADVVYAKISGETINRRAVIVPAAITVFLLVSAVVFGVIRLSLNGEKNGKTMKVAVVQSCISPWEDWERNKFRYLTELFRISDEALKTNPDFLIWSESATLEPMSFRLLHNIPSPFDERISSYAAEHSIPLLTGEIGIVRTERGIYQPQNNSILFSANGKVADTYSKIHLAPFGEWFPYDRIMPWVTDLTLSMGGSIFIPGASTPVFSVNGLRFGNLICYESMFFRLNREYARKNVDFLINITNDGWSSSYGGHYQHFSASPFRAVETGRWYIRAGNTGVTTVIDPKGRYKEDLPILSKGFITADINTGLNRVTLYSRIGDMFTGLIVCMLFAVIAVPAFRRKITK